MTIAVAAAGCSSGRAESTRPTGVTTSAGTAQQPTEPPSTSTTTTTPQRQTTVPSRPDQLPAGVTLRDLDGSYPAGLPEEASFFPIGVWLESVEGSDDIAADAAAGLNTYVGLVHNESTDLDAIESGGMHLLVQVDEWAGDPRASHPAVDGWLVSDEADMMFGPGWNEWNGRWEWNTCDPSQDAGGRCGYTVQERTSSRVPEGALRYSNYGMGVAFWETDDEAQVFINEDFQDVVSADVYFFTHPDVDASDRRGAKYGWLVDRVRHLDSLDGKRQPVWGFVEVGHPFNEEDAPTITAAQMRSAVWHSIIAGARGIVYFNHSFGGPCISQHVLRNQCDPEMTPAVADVNAQITDLAPVLNSAYADGYVTTTGPARAMAKLGPDGAWYVFAGADTLGADGGDVTFSVAAGSTVDVMYEDRALAVTDGQFVDTFDDGNAVHIYRIR